MRDIIKCDKTDGSKKLHAMKIPQNKACHEIDSIYRNTMWIGLNWFRAELRLGFGVRRCDDPISVTKYIIPLLIYRVFHDFRA